MNRRKAYPLIASALLGLLASSQVSAIVATCPPAVPACLGGNYATMGSAVWLCCKDSTHTACVNYYKQKYICNYNDPSEPASYGYNITSTTNKTSLNCDTVTTGNCY